MKSKRIIVTASNEDFKDYLFDLLDSIDHFLTPFSCQIGVLDLGLSDASKHNLHSRNTIVVKPGWDIDLPEETKKMKPYLRGLTARPFLREYYPNYETYLWLDADTWVQDESAIKMFFAAAINSSMALVPQVHHSYRHTQGSLHWRSTRLSAYYGGEFSRQLHINTYYNTGAFAVQNNTPHWELWAENMTKGIKNCDYKYICDQTALNHAIWENELNIHPLPATCNWCCHLSAPILARRNGKLEICEPHLPYRKIGIIHKTNSSKNSQVSVNLRGIQEYADLSFNGVKNLNKKLLVQG